MRENLTYGLMRGHQRQGDGRLERDTRPKREKRCLLTSPVRYCAGALLYSISAGRSGMSAEGAISSSMILSNELGVKS